MSYNWEDDWDWGNKPNKNMSEELNQRVVPLSSQVSSSQEQAPPPVSTGSESGGLVPLASSIAVNKGLNAATKEGGLRSMAESVGTGIKDAGSWLTDAATSAEQAMGWGEAAAPAASNLAPLALDTGATAASAMASGGTAAAEAAALAAAEAAAAGTAAAGAGTAAAGAGAGAAASGLAAAAGPVGWALLADEVLLGGKLRKGIFGMFG